MNLVNIVQVLWLVYIYCGISPRMQRVYLGCDELTLAFCRPQALAQGLLWICKCSVPCFCGFGYNFNCDDPRNTVLMMPSTTFPLLFRRRRPKKRWISRQILWRWPPWIPRWWSESESFVGGEGWRELVVRLLLYCIWCIDMLCCIDI